MQTTKPKVTVKQVREHCRKLGVPFRYRSNEREFCVGGYYTDDGQDAMDTAARIAERYVKLDIQPIR